MRISRFVLLALALTSLPVSAQQKKPLEHADYDIWNRIQNPTLSPDGRWLAYQLTPGDGDGRMIVRNLRTGEETEISRGASPKFSSDSRYVVARIAPKKEAVEAAKKEKKKGPDLPKDSLVVVDLSRPGEPFRAARVKSFELPKDGSGWMAYLLEKEKRGEEDNAKGGEPGGAQKGEAGKARKPEAGRAAGAGEKGKDKEKPPRTKDGTTLIVRDLDSGQERRFAYAVEYAFAEDGSALYYAASGEEGEADGVYRVRRSGDAEPVASGEGRYVKLAVARDGARAAFVTDRDDRGAEAPAFSLYIAPADGPASSAVAPGAEGLPESWAPSRYGDVSFSKSGGRLFFGTAAAPQPEPDDDTPDDEKVRVDVWNWKDPYLQPMQLLQAKRERERTYLAALDFGTGRVVQLATPEVPVVTVAGKGDGSHALGTSGLPYRQLISWDGRYVDVYTVDPSDGAREKVIEKLRGTARQSPDGKYLVWWDGGRRAWFAMDADTHEIHDLTGSVDVAFYRELDDHPQPPPPYGSAGWTPGDARLLVYDAYDVWAVDPTGREPPRDVTEGVGRRTHTRFRVSDLDPDDPYVPWKKDVLLSAFRTDTKAAGFYRDRFASSRPPEQLVLEDVLFSRPRKAKDADVLLFTKQTFEMFPDLWVGDPAFSEVRKVSDANPQQADYLWGTAELVHWLSADGIPLQGILYKPEGFDPAKKYPMMVYFYERMSDGLHRYVIPAAGSSSINRSFYVSRGYLLFVPDIPYRIGYPGESAVDAVVPGVLAIVAKGFVDREHIGVQGHSWGGYQISYMVTRTDIFAAAEAGAPVSDMISAYGGIRWGTGMSRMFQYEKTQSRIGGSLWEVPLRYIENSAIFTADKIRTPLLMLHNDKDTAVPWYQGIELFVALRRLHKPVWMLSYNGEPHGLRKPQNRKDWAIRMQQFFDHYLMGAPAPVWMEEGVPAVMKGRTLGLDLLPAKDAPSGAPNGRTR